MASMRSDEHGEATPQDGADACSSGPNLGLGIALGISVGLLLQRR